MKATQVSSTLSGIDVKRLPADAQRSLAQRMNAWAKQYGITIEEKKPTRSVHAPVRPIATQKESTPMPKIDIEAIVTRVVAEALAGIETEPTPIRRTTTRKAAPKRNTFYEDVIVGGYEKRAEAKPHKCEAKGCYKQGHRFTDAGWFGTKTTQGHLALAARYHKGR